MRRLPRLPRVPVPAAVRRAWAVVRPGGRAVLALAVLAYLVAVPTGWQEAAVVATTCLLVLALAVPFTLGRTDAFVEVEVSRPQVRVGERVFATLVVGNRRRRRLLPFCIELPVGRARQPFGIKTLGPQESVELAMTIPTSRRGIIVVGPAAAVREDPMGLLRRSAVTGGYREIVVYPDTVALGRTGSGFLRDLEGQSTRNLSMSDLAFHTLRDYVPGDDHRHIHWRSSARLQRLVVRQYLDTRRSRVALAVDADVCHYQDEDAFELAVSIATSMALRALEESRDVAVAAGGRLVVAGSRHQLLDGAARFTLCDGTGGLRDAAALAGRGPDTTVSVLVTGPHVPLADVRAAGARFPIDAVPLLIRVDPAAPAGLASVGAMRVLTVPRLHALPRLIASLEIAA